MKKIAIGSDHGGYQLKEVLKKYLVDLGHNVEDYGTFDEKSCDYPDFAKLVALAVAEKKSEIGILVCGSGVGVTVTANKIPGIRACLCHDTFSARQGVEDDDMNVLCLGGRVIGSELAKDLVNAFINAKFSNLERHKRRLNKVLDLDKVKYTVN